MTGRESLKAERPSRPVKIAESDADVSETPHAHIKDAKRIYFSLPFL